VIRVTLIKNSKILREYDFFLRRSLSRREAKSRSILSESYKRLEKFCEKIGHREEIGPLEEELGHIEEVNVDDLLQETSGKIFIISDLHLDHANIIKYCNRPFKSVYDMNNFIVNSWNKIVGKNDIVYFLGDMAYGRGSRKTRFWLEKLNGNVVFIKGYHDRFRNIKFYDKLILNYKGRRFLLVHNPQDAPSGWNDWIIHGHTHNNNPEYPLINKDKKTINVSAELLGYKPILLEDLLSKLGGSIGKEVIECSYYDCKEKDGLARCKHCGKLFCKEHIKSKHPFFSSEEVLKGPGHICPPFYDYMKNKKKEDFRKRKKALDKMSGKQTSLLSAEGFYLSTIPDNKEKEKHEREQEVLKEMQTPTSESIRPAKEYSVPVRPVKKHNTLKLIALLILILALIAVLAIVIAI
jgi:calcineurin-like phosphoesterase family protein